MSKYLKIMACCLVGVMLYAEEPNAAAQDTPLQDVKAAETVTSDKEQEWNISADSMDMMMDNHIIEMEGNVTVEDETVRLTARKMIVHLDENNKMKDIEAYGNVTVRKLDSSESATGDTGKYDAVQETVVLSGNCILLKDKTTLTGDTVIYNRKTNVIGMKRATITLPVKKGDSSGFGNFLGDKKTEGADKKTDGADKKTEGADKKTEGTKQTK